jgi:hypothetical protein
MLTPPPALPPIKKMRALTVWLNDLRAYCASLNPMPSANVRINHTAIGTSWESTAAAETSPKKPNAGMVFRGEWSAAVDYLSQDVVVIRGGISGGCYICIRDAPAGVPPTFPADSDFWVQLSPGNALGDWQ